MKLMLVGGVSCLILAPCRGALARPSAPGHGDPVPPLLAMAKGAEKPASCFALQAGSTGEYRTGRPLETKPLITFGLSLMWPVKSQMASVAWP